MMIKQSTALLILGTALFGSSALLAHHAPSAIFNMKEKAEMKGKLTRVDWVNPHIVIALDVTEGEGPVSWKVESSPPRWFSKMGVSRADFAGSIGQTVTVEVVKALDGSKYGYLRTITFSNGNRLVLDE